MDRLTSVSETASGFPTATAGYLYDAAGRPWTTTYGNNDQIVYGYDGESRLTSLTIKNGATTVKTLVYVPDAMGNLQSLTADGAQTVYAYDAGYQLIREVLPNGGDVNEWDYDGAGNLVTARRPGVSTGYLVNNDDELTEASGATTVTGQVTGGPNNNKWYNSWAECRGVRARVSTVNGSFTLAGVPVYAGANALQVKVTDASGNQTTQTRNVTNTLSYAAVYDGNGNLTSRASAQGSRVYTWNALNQLVSASLGGATVLQNWYDAYGRRIAKQEVIGGATNKWYYVYDGWLVIAVLDGSNGALLESYTRGIGLAGDVGTLIAARHHSGTYNNQVIYLHSNHRGDVILARNSTTTIGAYDYAPYGALLSTSGAYDSRFKFSSKERDASADIYYFGFRFYDPNLQRWLNRDPMGELGGINLYAFCDGNPLNFIDPVGCNEKPSGPDPGGFRYRIVSNTGTVYDHIVLDATGIRQFKRDLSTMRIDHEQISELHLYGHGRPNVTALGNLNIASNYRDRKRTRMNVPDIHIWLKNMLNAKSSVWLEFCDASSSDYIISTFTDAFPETTIIANQGISSGFGDYGVMWNPTWVNVSKSK